MRTKINTFAFKKVQVMLFRTTIVCMSLVTIGAAILVGIYYAIVDRKKSVDNYYYGGRQMSPVNKIPLKCDWFKLFL